MTKRFLYYELIGSDIFGIEPGLLFTKTRKRPIVMYRQLMMYYRREVLKMSYADASRRYDKDHATAIHSVKAVNYDKDTNRDYREAYGLFMASCEKRAAKEKKELIVIEPEVVSTIDNVKELVDTIFSRQNALRYYVDVYRADQTALETVLSHIVLCRSDLEILNQIFCSTKAKELNDYKGIVGTRRRPGELGKEVGDTQSDSPEQEK
jgi:hypothetical protein